MTRGRRCHFEEDVVGSPASAFLLCVDLRFRSCLPQYHESCSARVRKTGLVGCGPPAFNCVLEVNTTKIPAPGPLQLLIKVAGSSINADDIPTLGIPAVHYTLRIDVAGIIQLWPVILVFLIESRCLPRMSAG